MSGLITNWEKVETLDDLAALIRHRLVQLRAMYGKASDLPIYPIPIERDQFSGKNGALRVVLAQTLLPKQADFTKSDPCLNNSPTYRALHRCHLSSLCSLILTQLKAQKSVERGREGADEPVQKSTADLIILPELTVHPDDVWILKQLSEKTKAMIFFGLTPIFRSGVGLVNTACWLIPNKRTTGRSWIVRYQGKHHPTVNEKAIGLQGWRPYQVVIELSLSASGERGYRITGAVCYDATDLNLAADLRNVSDLFVITAMNRDIATFDNMVAALHYHMYQHVVLVNTGEFGGSTVQAPFKEQYDKLITHHHGGGQIGISIFDVDINDFGPIANTAKPPREKKGKPAGFTRFN
ncbi:MAG: hypothetical protein HQM01_12885 [Magnetococcales bacterium]|nr:hypothetical protein [Magnetococcales bacterium]